MLVQFNLIFLFEFNLEFKKLLSKEFLLEKCNFIEKIKLW